MFHIQLSSSPTVRRASVDKHMARTARLIIFGAHSLQAPPLPQLPEMPDHNASLSSMSWWSSDGTSFHAIVATGVGMSTRTLVSPCDDLPLFALVQRSAVRARLKPSSD